VPTLDARIDHAEQGRLNWVQERASLLGDADALVRVLLQWPGRTLYSMPEDVDIEIGNPMMTHSGATRGFPTFAITQRSANTVRRVNSVCSLSS
jgi:hypothetical protein